MSFDAETSPRNKLFNFGTNQRAQLTSRSIVDYLVSFLPLKAKEEDCSHRVSSSFDEK
jgi:hypothetical protein